MSKIKLTDIDTTGAAEGEVATVQSDGSLEYQPLPVTGITHYRYPVFGGSGPIEPMHGPDGESIYMELSHG